MVELLIGFWTEIAERRVEPTPVVERLDVVEVRSCLVVGPMRAVVSLSAREWATGFRPRWLTRREGTRATPWNKTDDERVPLGRV